MILLKPSGCNQLWRQMRAENKFSCKNHTISVARRRRGRMLKINSWISCGSFHLSSLSLSLSTSPIKLFQRKYFSFLFQLHTDFHERREINFHKVELRVLIICNCLNLFFSSAILEYDATQFPVITWLLFQKKNDLLCFLLNLQVFIHFIFNPYLISVCFFLNLREKIEKCPPRTQLFLTVFLIN